MAYPQSLAVTLSGSASSAVSGATTEAMRGFVRRITFGGTLSSTAVVTVTGRETSQAILSQTIGATAFTRAPYLAAHTTAGAALAPTTGGGSFAVPIAIANEHIKYSVSKTTAGGQTGTFRIWVG